MKREGVFAEEDLDTIRRMKSALTTSKNYEFSYWDNRKGLLRFLEEQRPDFVLNLCDEGFMNDPFKELHITAILEMLGIPYSGAGPRALGLCYDKALVRSVGPVPRHTRAPGILFWRRRPNGHVAVGFPGPGETRS